MTNNKGNSWLQKWLQTWLQTWLQKKRFVTLRFWLIGNALVTNLFSLIFFVPEICILNKCLIYK